MLLSCVNTKKKKRKVSTLDEDSISMWLESRGTPLPNGRVTVSSSRTQSPPAPGLGFERMLASTTTICHNIRQQPTQSPIPMPESFGIVIVADLDKKSKDNSSKKPQFMSFIMHATLKVTSSSLRATSKRDKYSVVFGDETKFLSSMNEAGRGFELSELAWFGGKLLAFDDRTGIVYRLKHFESVSKSKPLQAIPEHIIMEGDGINGKGQKHEWATVKDAIMDSNGDVHHEDWTANYGAVRKALGCEWPGYVVHEAIEWSPIRRQWFILPRRISTEKYNDMDDEKRGSNKFIIASEDFSSIQVHEVGKITPLRGFSSFKFVPRSDDSVIVAIKSVEVEVEQHQTSYITVFDVDGNVLMEETEIPGAKKYEGVAFAHDWSS
ncbi:apyrase family protein [Plasmopara halstedii]|uniref:Apyrase family protein n=1 Tax=Plasmopara halstedii TaxID=4781 RepID=A0A0P1AX90_PLAHL|nr:apyrase family protein [Plasmopara halstedii]CEG45676.1 apyrase family protein [Plasmopara halstedii]|eukprot:XP_024582045.1 apyrase family protein [Plasmopara halstedii]